MRHALALAATALLLQACTERPPAATGPRVFQADLVGAAKSCTVPKVTPTAGQETPVEIKMGNDGGWCAITVNDAGKPFDAGLLLTEPAHGKVYIHTVGDETRIDYTPEPRFAGSDAFAVRLIPGGAVLRASVAVGQ
ncbi:MAG TPA: hypothetical protein VHY82_15345 [Acetobacteraceae bacterium]|jgi:hypothetical protein|nr:hypothetical protein [Acetobacteraceae bacterium]